MLRESATAVHAARPVRSAVVLVITWVALATAGCGIKGPLRPATTPSPTPVPAASDVGPPPPPADPDPAAPRKP